jgi:hypothetical protein
MVDRWKQNLRSTTSSSRYGMPRSESTAIDVASAWGEYLNDILGFLPSANYPKALRAYEDIWALEAPDFVVAAVAEADRYFFLTQILRRPDALHPWLYERCREVEHEPDDCLDLWARGHYKSTFITFAGSLQEIIRNQNITIAIFSHTRPIAKAFLDQIKGEMEGNPELHRYWPDIFWANPRREAPVWSLDNGIIVKRTSNPKEKTVEAWGLVDGQPISKHFDLRIYNDVVTESSVTTAEMILKTTRSWELSQNISVTEQEGVIGRQWHEGTRYNYADTYGVIIERQALKPRVYAATDDGTMDGEPVFLTKKAWAKKKRNESTHTIACQQLQNPIAGSIQEFTLEMLRYYEVRPATLNVAILVDPANSKNKDTSNTAFAVMGVDAAWNKYLLDGACHKMNLTERWTMLKNLRNKWINQPGVQIVRIGYERYGMQADIEHFREMMRIEKCPFPIEEVSWARETNSQAKDDRIRRLEPDARNWRLFFPYPGKRGKTSDQQKAIESGKAHLVAKPITRKNENGELYDLVQYMIKNEWLFFPATVAKDFMDAMSRIYDLEGLNPPQIYHQEQTLPEYADDF